MGGQGKGENRQNTQMRKAEMENQIRLLKNRYNRIYKKWRAIKDPKWYKAHKAKMRQDWHKKYKPQKVKRKIWSVQDILDMFNIE